MYKLIIGNKLEWLYDGPRALWRAKVAARIMLRRHKLKIAHIVPFDFHGEPIIVSR